MNISINSFIRLGFYQLLVVIGLTILPALASAEVIGEVIQSENMPIYPKGTKITKGMEIKTNGQQKIAIKTRDGDVLVAGKNATIKIKEPGFFSHLFGKIYYFIAPRQTNKVKVTTSTATIGIRGTKFIIDSDEADASNETVSLASGKLNFESNDDELFELYHQRELTEFEQYKRQQQSDFNEYKQQMMDEFVAYKASIDLDSGFALKFDGKKATRIALDNKVDAEFAEFERFIADINIESGKE